MEKVLNPQSKGKIFCIGIDALDRRLMKRLCAKGMLPNLKGLIEGGVSGKLRTLRPALSGPVWTTIATGKLPRKHGVKTQFCYLKDGEIKPIPPGKQKTMLNDENVVAYAASSKLRKTKALWNILGEHGRKVCVLNWWATWPVESVNGIMVSDNFFFGMPVPVRSKLDKSFINPESFLKEFKKTIPPKKLHILNNREIRAFFPEFTSDEFKRFKHITADDGDFLTTLKFTYLQDKLFLEITKHILDNYPPFDFFAVYFSGIDAFCHRLWGNYLFGGNRSKVRFRHAIIEYYRFTDKILGELVSRIKNDYTIFVLSDHGFTGSRFPDEEGGHEAGPDGVFIAKGTDIRQGHSVRNMGVCDITPTILHYYGIPAGEDMDGKIALNIFNPQFRKKHPVSYVNTHDIKVKNDMSKTPVALDKKQQKMIMDKLEALGYV